MASGESNIPQLYIKTNNTPSRAESTKDLEDSPLLQEVMHIETEIGKLRSTGSNYSNYVPALRVLDQVKETLGIGPGPAYGRDIGKRRLAYVLLLANTHNNTNYSTLGTIKSSLMS